MTDFEHYMYIVPMKINKLCPKLADDEDFLQDCYLDFLEYTQKSKSFNNPKNLKKKTTLAHGHITWFINRELRKLENKNEIADGLLLFQKDFCDIEKIVFQNDLRKITGELLNTLTKRERGVLEEIYYARRNHRVTGEKYGVTKERIRQIESKAISKMRHPSRIKRIRAYYG